MTSRPARGVRYERRLFATLLVLHLAPIWLFGHLVTQDGPAHLANAWILLRLALGECPIAADFFVANWRLSPNWLAHFALAGLGLAFPPVVAEKLLQSACVAALPLAGRYAIGAIDRDARFLSLALFPLALGFPLLMGFHGFCLGIALGVWLYGFWARGRGRSRLGSVLALAVGGVVAFFAHPLGLALAVLLIGLSEADLARREWVAARRAGGAAAGAVLSRHAAAPLALALPAAGLSLAYLSTSHTGGTIQWLWLPEKLLQLATGWALVGYAWTESLFATLWVWIVLALAIRAASRAPRHPLAGGLAAAGLVLLALLLAAPDSTPRVGVLTDRVAVAFLAALVLLAATAGAPRRTGLLAGLLVAAGLGLLAAKSWKLVEIDAVLHEYLSVEPHLVEGSTLLPIHLRVSGPQGDRSASARIDPLLHATGYLAARRCIVSLSNYEATHPAVFPTHFRPALDPYRMAHYDEYAPEWTDLEGYAQRTGRTVDQVLVWGRDADVETLDAERREPMRALLARVRAGYGLVFTTPGPGLGRLYRRRAPGIPAPPPAATLPAPEPGLEPRGRP